MCCFLFSYHSIECSGTNSCCQLIRLITNKDKEYWLKQLEEFEADTGEQVKLSVCFIFFIPFIGSSAFAMEIRPLHEMNQLYMVKNMWKNFIKIGKQIYLPEKNIIEE